MHYYKFNIKDWTRDTAHLSVEEEGVYRRLLDLYYESESPIPLETQSVIRRLRLGSHTEAVGLILSEFFREESDGYHHSRCDAEIAKYHAKAGANRENGRSGGRPKKPKENPDGFEKEPTNNLNHKPLTTNQEPKEKSSCDQQADHAATFDSFWKLYPNKTGKKPAQQAWTKLKPEGELLNMIMSALALQRSSHDWTKDGGQYVPHARTWLNQNRWEDEVRDGRQDTRTSGGTPSLVDQVRERNRQREAERGGDFGGESGFRTFDGEVVGIDDEHVRPQMDLSAWT